MKHLPLIKRRSPLTFLGVGVIQGLSKFTVMKVVQSGLVAFAIVGCTVQETDKATNLVVPVVSTGCANHALYFEDSTEGNYGFPVYAILRQTDTANINVKCDPMTIVFTMAGDTNKHFLDHPENPVLPNRISIDLGWRYSTLDSFSIYVDTSQILNFNSCVRCWNDTIPYRHQVTRAYAIFIQNLTDDTARILEEGSLTVEYKDRKGNWQRTMYSSLMCTTGMHYYWVLPNEYIVMMLPLTKGKYTREFRVSLDDVYSNTFFASCNYKY